MHFHFDMVQDRLEPKRLLPQLAARLGNAPFSLPSIENWNLKQSRHVVRIEGVVPPVSNKAILPLCDQRRQTFTSDGGIGQLRGPHACRLRHNLRPLFQGLLDGGLNGRRIEHIRAKFIGQCQRSFIGERQQVEEVQLGALDGILRGGSLLPLASQLRVEPREVKAGRNTCALALFDKP